MKTKEVKTKDNKNNKGTANPKDGIVGKIKELGTHVYIAGGKQQHHYTKITAAIADYVGGLYDMDIRMLVKESKDSPPLEPEVP